MVKSGETTLSSQFVQSLTRLPIFIVLALQKHRTRQSTGPPNSPKESGSSPVRSITYLRHLLILPINFYPDISHSKRFPRFPVSSSNSPRCHRIWSGFKLRALRFQLLFSSGRSSIFGSSGRRGMGRDAFRSPSSN